MRALLILLVLASGLGALAAPSPAQAWYGRWGRWHPNEYRRYPLPRIGPTARPAMTNLRSTRHRRSINPPPYYRPPPPAYYPPY